MADSSELRRQSTKGATARDNREYAQRLKQALAGDSWALQHLKDAANSYRCAAFLASFAACDKLPGRALKQQAREQPHVCGARCRRCVRAYAGLSLAWLPRSGALSADELREDFARALDGAMAPQLFADLAGLLPPGSQRVEIRAAAARAGWGASPDPTTGPSDGSAQALPRATVSAQAGQPYSTRAGGAGAGSAEDAGAPASAAPPPGDESAGTGWVPLERSRVAERADQLASELAGGPHGGVAVEDAGSEAARRSMGVSQAPGAAQEQRAGDAAHAGADTVRGSAPGGAAGRGALTPAEREAAALEAAGLNEWGSPARATKRPRRGAAAGAAGAPSPSAKAPPNVLFWLRQELRLHDNLALSSAAAEAARRGGVLTCMYVHSPEEDGDALHGGARPGPGFFAWAGA